MSVILESAGQRDNFSDCHFLSSKEQNVSVPVIYNPCSKHASIKISIFVYSFILLCVTLYDSFKVN
jgi:hypothetical protein